MTTLTCLSPTLPEKEKTCSKNQIAKYQISHPDLYCSLQLLFFNRVDEGMRITYLYISSRVYLQHMCMCYASERVGRLCMLYSTQQKLLWSCFFASVLCAGLDFHERPPPFFNKREISIREPVDSLCRDGASMPIVCEHVHTNTFQTHKRSFSKPCWAITCCLLNDISEMHC